MDQSIAGDGSEAELKLDPARWLPGVRTTLDEQIEIAQRVDHISRRQSELIAEGNLELAARMLEDRQPLVERMSELAGELAPVAGRIGELALKLPVYDRGTLIERVSRLQGLLDAVNQRDETDRLAFEQHRQRLGAELAGIDRGRSANSAYGGAAAETGPSFQDREG